MYTRGKTAIDEVRKRCTKKDKPGDETGSNRLVDGVH